MLGKPILQRAQVRVLQIPVEIVPQPGHVAQVSWLAIAMSKAREDAQDLGIALRAEREVRKFKGRAIEAGVRRCRVFAVVGQ